MVWAVASIADEHDFFMIESLTDGAGKLEEGRFWDGGLFSTTAVVTSQHSCSLLFYFFLYIQLGEEDISLAKCRTGSRWKRVSCVAEVRAEEER